MTTQQLNAELLRELSTIVTDDDMVRKAIKALKRIIVNSKKKEIDETQYVLSSPEMVDIIKEGDEEIRSGQPKPIKLDDLWK